MSRKISQHINKITCKWIPLPTLDKEWTDDEVYKYFKLTPEQIKLVKETKISGYKDIIKKEVNDNITESYSSSKTKIKAKPKKSTKSKTKIKAKPKKSTKSKTLVI